MATYKSYTHVERIDSEECEGLLDNDKVYVTAKVDGTNGCVFWNEATGSLGVGSRNLVLGPDEDNAYFHEWATGGSEEARLLRSYCEGHPGHIVYGEWMGKTKFVGAFKGYAPDALGKFLIFDVYDTENGEYLPEDEWRKALAAFGLEPFFIKLLAVYDHPSMKNIEAALEGNEFLLEGTGCTGEGVVCKAPGWKNRFGRAVYGKLVYSEFKKQAKPAAMERNVEAEIIDQFVTDAEIEKTMAKICTMTGEDTFSPESRKMMGMLTSFCWKDLLTECPNWVKKLKNPTVNFGKLSGLCTKRVQDFAKRQ